MTSPLARVGWETTLAERLDVADRMVDLPLMARALAIGPSVGAAVGAVAGYLILRWQQPQLPWLLPAGVAVVVGAAAVAWNAHPTRGERRRAAARARARRRALRAWGDGPVRFDVELHADALRTTAPRIALTLPWRTVRRLDAHPDRVEIASTRAIVVVRAHAFPSADAFARFVHLARERLAAAAAEGPPAIS